MLQKPVISIVDDDTSVRDGTADLVMAMGYIAQVFPHVEEFLQSSSFQRTSCLISDLRMPGMTGLELHNHLVRSGYNIPTILITAFQNERDRASAMSAQVTCYLTKPFSDDNLLACIRAALEHRGDSGIARPRSQIRGPLHVEGTLRSGAVDVAVGRIAGVPARQAAQDSRPGESRIFERLLRQIT